MKRHKIKKVTRPRFELAKVENGVGCRRSLRERSAHYAHEFNYSIKATFGSHTTHHNIDVTLYNPVHDIKVVQAGDCRYAKQVGARPRDRLHGLGERTVDALGPPRPAVLNCRAISRPFSFPKLENKDRLAIARRSLKDKSVTIVRVTRTCWCHMLKGMKSYVTCRIATCGVN